MKKKWRELVHDCKNMDTPAWLLLAGMLGLGAWVAYNMVWG